MLLTGYEAWMIEQNHSPNTRRQRLKFARRLLREWGTFDVPAVDVVTWLSQYDGWTYHTYLNHITGLYEFLVDQGHVGVSPVARMRRRTPPAPRPRPLAPGQRDRVLATAQGDLRAICLLAYLAGLRAHEVAKVCGEHITATHLHVVGKGGKAADLPTHERLWELAQTYPRRGYWFPGPGGHLSADTITGRVTAHFRALGIEEGSLHRLRHTFAQDMADNGVHPRTIQELMRHASLATTMRYLEAGDERKLRAVTGLVVPGAALAA